MTSFAIHSVRLLHVRLALLRRERALLRRLTILDITQRNRITELNALERHLVTALGLLYY